MSSCKPYIRTFNEGINQIIRTLTNAFIVHHPLLYFNVKGRISDDF